jgi:integrase
MAYVDVPAFLARLRGRDTVGAMALEFCVLTAARAGEVLGARWSEIDLDAGVWTIPAERMKARIEHRVPLSDRAVEILDKVKLLRTSEFVFPGQRPNKPSSHITLRHQLQVLGVDGATVHGFRSSFRDWAGNETPFPREIAEQALAHVIGDRAEQAYRRGDALAKRRDLMDAWARHCEPRGADGATIIELSARRG